MRIATKQIFNYRNYAVIQELIGATQSIDASTSSLGQHHIGVMVKGLPTACHQNILSCVNYVCAAWS